MIPNKPTSAQGESGASQGYALFPKVLLGEIVTQGGTRERLSDKERTILLTLIGYLKPGQTTIDVKQITVAATLQCTDRHLRRCLARLRELFGLLFWRHKRDPRTRQVRGTIWDLTGYLRLLPEKTLRTLGLAFLIRTEMSGRSEAEQGGQQTLDLAPAELEDASEASEDAPPTYRTSMSAQEQEQAMLAEQQNAGAEPETPPVKARTEAQAVVALLRQEWPDGSRMSWATAWICVKRRGEEICRDQVAALPYRKPKKSWAGLLRDSILKEKNGWEMPAALIQERRRKPRRPAPMPTDAEREAAAARQIQLAAARSRQHEPDPDIARLTPEEYLPLLDKTRLRFRGVASFIAELVRFEPHEDLKPAKRSLVHKEMLKTLTLQGASDENLPEM